MFPSYKKEISSKTVGCFMLMTYSPSRCASSWLHAIITSPVIRPMAPALMFHPKTSITQFRDTALQIWSLWTIWGVWAFWQTRFMGTPTLQIFWIGKWWGTNFRNLTCLRPITHDITVINIILCQALHCEFCVSWSISMLEGCRRQWSACQRGCRSEIQGREDRDYHEACSSGRNSSECDLNLRPFGNWLEDSPWQCWGEWIVRKTWERRGSSFSQLGLEPLLRNDVACSPWVYQPAGLGISYPYTTYILLQCAAQVVRHRSLSTRCPCGPLWPTSIWSSLHCKRFDYHGSLVSTLLLNFWFLRLLSLTRLFTFFDFSKLSSFPSTFAFALATFALGSRLCLGLCTRLGSWGSSRSFAGILGPAVLSCMTWLAAMAAFHWLWAITRKVSFLAAVVASDTLRALLWPCSHMHFAVQVIGESHSGVVCYHRLPNPGNSSCTTVELNILCHLLRQISQIHQKLVALVDTQITQLACNQWSLQLEWNPSISAPISRSTSIRACLSDFFTVYFRQASLYCSASGRLIKLNSLRSNLKSSKPFASWMP